MPEYKPFGPQINVPLSRVTFSRWKPCYISDYPKIIRDSDIDLIAKSNCTGKFVMMSCGRGNSSSLPQTLDLLAWGPRQTIFGKTSSGQGQVQNGVRFYRNKSWGFAKASSTISQSPCDNKNTDAAYRLCWHSDGSNRGWRCGEEKNLYTDARWQRVIFDTDW